MSDENNNTNDDIEQNESSKHEEKDNNSEEFENDDNSAEQAISENYDDYDFNDDFEISETDTYPVSADSETFMEYSDVVDSEISESKALRKKRRKSFFKKIKIPAIISVSVIVCIFIAVFLYALSSIPENTVMKNIYIGNINVGGFSYDETVSSIKDSYQFDSEITLSSGFKNYPIKSSDIGMAAIPEDTAKKAMEYCKTGNFLVDGFRATGLLFGKHVITPSAQVDTEKLDEKINEFGNIVLGERIQHGVELGDDGMVTVIPGHTGYDGNPASVRDVVTQSLKDAHFTNISVTYNSAPPDDMTIEAFDALVYKEAVNAKYEVVDNKVTVVPGDTGRYINKEEAAPLLTQVHEGGETVKIPFYVSQPELTAATLKEKLFTDTLASYSTSYSGSTSNRCANISRAASLINGTVVAPGEVFSFNDTVGRRTTANGFYTAKEYVDGKSVDGIGGGTCQVSSTLYSAVLYADMNIIERLNHMMTVGYIPLGQDATVSDGGIDFKFKNSSDYPVKISAATSGTTVTINIIGTQWTPNREVKIYNSSSQSGKNTVVTSIRKVYANGELISTDTLPSSTYKPHEPDPSSEPEQ